MSKLEQPFIDAISAKQIEGVLLQGRNKAGKRYSNVIGNRILPNGSELPLAANDILFLASATKFLTTVAALQCCDKGLLSLDKDLRPELPNLTERGVLVSDEDSPKTKPIQRPLTLRHLLTHSSGLAYNFLDPKLKKWQEANLASTSGPDVPSRYTYALIFQPGEGWAYGIGIDWAGYLVEQATGVKLDEFIRTNILKLVGVAPTELSFFPIKEGMGDRMPDLNPKDPKGEGLSAGMGQSVHKDNLGGCFGGQGGYATLEAYIAVLASIMNNDGKLLSKETVAEMHKPQLEPKAYEGLQAALQIPQMGVMFSQGVGGQDRNYGLGGLLAGDGDEVLGKGSLVWGGGINTGWFIDPVNGVCGIVSPQLGIPGDMMKAMELKVHFRKELKRLLDASE